MYGNSHTSFLEGTLRNLIFQTKAPLNLVVRAEPASQFMYMHLERTIKNVQDWAAWHVDPDYVILQEQSGIPTWWGGKDDFLLNYTKSENSFAAMTYLIKNNTRAEAAIYFTFIHFMENPEHASIFYKNLNTGIRRYASKCEGNMQKHVPVVPVGPVFEYFRRGNPDWFKKLYDTDERHFSKYGSYLTACVFISTFTKIRMTGKWVPDEDDEFYGKLQTASDYVVFKTHDPWKPSLSRFEFIYEKIFGPRKLHLDQKQYEEYLRNSIYMDKIDPSFSTFGVGIALALVLMVIYAQSK